MTPTDTINSICAHGIALADKATPGPWETDTIDNDGEYGSGEDSRSGFKSYEITDQKGLAVADTLNSGHALIHEEHDEDGGYAWDEIGKHNASFIAHSRTLLPAALTALQGAVAALDEMLVCTCSRPTKVLPGGGVQAPGDHTPKCIMSRRQNALARIAASLTAAQTP